MTSLEDYLKDYKVKREEVIDGVKVIVIMEMKKKNVESMKEAQKRYREKNKDKINSYMAEWKRDKYNNDEEFKEKAKECRRRCYQKKKEKEVDEV